MSNKMEPIGENNEYFFFMSEFMGNPVRVMLSKETQEISFVADDVAVGLGYKNLEDMMSDDEILDGYSELVKLSPKDALQPVDLPDFVKGGRV